MKKILSLLAVILFAAIGAYSQTPAPGIFNYQGVARNSVGNVLINQAIALRLTIHDVASGGPVVYQEVRGVITNPFGLFNAQVGSAGFTSQIGTIAGVNWGVGNKYIQVEIDPAGGSSFINIGTAQIASVPYALYASLANDLVLPFNKTQADAGTLFKITNSNTVSAGATSLEGLTNSTSANVSAIIGTVTTASAGGFSAGVKGINNGNAGNGIGVYGTQNGSGWGVYGVTPSGIGVFGSTTSGTGVVGSSTSGNGVNGTSSTGIGVFGTSNTGNAGRFDITNAANNTDALVANTNGGAASWALRATSTGAQGAGIFTYNNPAGTANTIRTTNNGSGAAISATAIASGNAGFFSNTNAANNASPVVITTNSTNAPGLSISGPNIWGSALGITNTTSGMEWRTSVNGTTYTVTKIPGATFSPFLLFSDGQVEFPSTAGANRLRILDNGNVGLSNATPAYRLDVDATSAGSSNGVRVRNTASFATVDIMGAGNDQALRFGKAGALWSGINTLPDGDHINFFKFGVGNLMAVNVNTGNLGVGGTIINPVAKVHARGFNTTNNLYSSSTGFLGATGIGSNDITAQPTNEKWGIHTFVNGAVGTQHAIFAEPGTTATINTGLFGRVSTAPAGGQSFGLFAFDAVNNGTTTWAATVRGRLQYQDGTQANNFILRSDVNGNANWADPAALFPGAFLWTRVGTNLWNTNLGDNVGVGTVAPTHRFTVSHGGSTGISVSSTAGFSVVDINAASGDAAIRFGNAGINQWNMRNRPADNYLEIFELGGGGSRVVIQDATGNVGIGATVAPSYKLDVEHGGATGIRSLSTGSFSVVDIDGFSGDAALRFQKQGVGMWNTRNRPADDYYEIFELGGGGSRVVIQDGTGNVGIGQTVAPAYKLDVQHGGATGIRSQSTASFSVVDIDAASGDAALRFQKAGVNQWNIRNRPADDYLEIFELGGGGSRMVIQDATGNVGIGQTVAPAYRLDVQHGGATGIRSQSTASFSVVDIDAASGDAALRFQKAGVNQWNTRNNPSTDDYQIFELGGGGERLQIQDGSGNIGIGGISPGYRLDVQHGGATGVHVVSTATFSVVDIDGANGDAALRFQKAGVNQWNTRNNPATDDYQIFELGGGGERMRIDNTTGKVWVNNDFTVLGVKLFTMDHPLDPANKTLMHAAAESNEVINFYSGNITTDASGKATVSLPDYFEAINKDFRYQLTVIGAFAQAIISKEVSNNKFEIATSQPNVKVSWEVKGVRNDAHMKMHPFVAEENKTADQKGKYFDPLAHNQSASKGVSYDANLASSLDDVKPVQKKTVDPASITGGSLDYTAPKIATNKPADISGSVANVEPAKVVVKTLDVSGSVIQTEANRPATKKADNSGSVSEEMQKPVINTQEPKTDKAIEPAKQVKKAKENLPAVLKGTSLDPDARPVAPPVKTPEVAVPAQNSGNTQPAAEQKQVSKENNSVPSSNVPVKKD